MTSTRYLLQPKGNSCCVLYALANALVFFGRARPEPGTAEWEELVDLAGCRDGAAVAKNEVARRLGLSLAPTSNDKAFDGRQPAILTVDNPMPYGGSLHAVLFVGWTDDGRVRLVNYRYGKGPVVEDVPWPPPMPPKGNINRRASVVSILPDRRVRAGHASKARR